MKSIRKPRSCARFMALRALCAAPRACAAPRSLHRRPTCTAAVASASAAPPPPAAPRRALLAAAACALALPVRALQAAEAKRTGLTAEQVAARALIAS